MSDPRTSAAPGGPGIEPTWSSSGKDAVGASHFLSRVWFTIGHGILNEVYQPPVDPSKIRELGFIAAADDADLARVEAHLQDRLDSADSRPRRTSAAVVRAPGAGGADPRAGDGFKRLCLGDGKPPLADWRVWKTNSRPVLRLSRLRVWL